VRAPEGSETAHRERDAHQTGPRPWLRRRRSVHPSHALARVRRQRRLADTRRTPRQSCQSPTRLRRAAKNPHQSRQIRRSPSAALRVGDYPPPETGASPSGRVPARAATRAAPGPRSDPWQVISGC